MWLVLAVLLPLLYGIALAVRRPPPTMESLPAALRVDTGELSPPEPAR
jgi:hypothetical protein